MQFPCGCDVSMQAVFDLILHGTQILVKLWMIAKWYNTLAASTWRLPSSGTAHLWPLKGCPPSTDMPYSLKCVLGVHRNDTDTYMAWCIPHAFVNWGYPRGQTWWESFWYLPWMADVSTGALSTPWHASGQSVNIIEKWQEGHRLLVLGYSLSPSQARRWK